MISATVANALHAVSVTCTSDELNIIQPPSGICFCYLIWHVGQTCQTYLGPFLESPANLGQILNPNATSNCEYCRFSQGDAYLATLNMYWSQRWRNFGIFLAYVPSSAQLTEGILFSTFLPSSYYSTWLESPNWRRNRLLDLQRPRSRM